MLATGDKADEEGCEVSSPGVEMNNVRVLKPLLVVFLLCQSSFFTVSGTATTTTVERTERVVVWSDEFNGEVKRCLSLSREYLLSV